MRHKQLFKTYVWLVETVYRFGPLTFDEIRDRWEYSSLYEGIPMARTSFNRHRDEIEDIFGIRIVCDRSNSCRYSIADLRVPDRNSVLSWMANTLSLNNIIAENRAVHDRILLEPVPSEGETLRCAIEAMKTSRMIGIEYHKYQSEEILHYEVEPYCVKLYNRRWYVLVRFPLKDDFRILSFDRICRLEVLPKTFVMPEDFSASEFFKDFYGIYYAQSALPLKPDKMYYMQGGSIADYRVYDYESGSYVDVYDMEALSGRDPYEMFLHGSKSVLTIENPNSKSGRSLIMFRDSFGSSIAPLIAEGFDRVTLVDIRYVAPELLGRMIDFSQYTDALFLYGTGVINNSETIK